MIKLTFALMRLPHLTREAFLDYWHNHHAPLAASLREPLRIRRYVQSHSLPEAISQDIRRGRGAPPEFDGVAELWYTSFEDIAEAMSHREAREANRRLLADERNFIDLPRSPLWWTQEREIF